MSAKNSTNINVLGSDLSAAGEQTAKLNSVLAGHAEETAKEIERVASGIKALEEEISDR